MLEVIETTRNLPKISIVTPVYNCVRYIENCIFSVLNQNCDNLEYIVIDGGSNDGTVEIIEKYVKKLAYFVSEKDSGQTQALNKGFAKATGDVFAWLNADEEYLPGTLLDVTRAFSDTPDLDFYYGQRIIVDSDKREIGRKKWPPMHPKWQLLYRMSVLPTDASFWSAKVHRLTGTLDEKNFPRLSMDYDWLLRLSFNVRKWRSTSKYLAKYTERSDRATMVGAGADQAVIRRNNYLARSKVVKRYRLTRLHLLVGWIMVRIWMRIVEKRFSLLTISIPKIVISLKRLLFIDQR